MRLISSLAFALLVPFSVASAQEAQDPVAQLMDQRATEATRRASSPRGAAALMRLHALRDDVEDLRPIARTEQALGFGPRVNPLTRAAAQELYLNLQRGRGQEPRVRELTHSLGFLHDFEVLGAFDNEGKAGCGTDFGPEKSLDLSATYAGKGHEIRWNKVTAEPQDGFIDLGSAVRPNHDAVAYALTLLSLPSDRNVNLALGTSGAFKLWVDGHLATSSETYHAPRPDQARVAVHLHKGLNRVLLKVCHENGPFGFFLRTEGGALATSLPDKLPPVPAHTNPAPKQLPTLTSTLAALVKAHPKDAALRADYAYVLNHDRAFEEREHSDAVEADRAADLGETQKLPAEVRSELQLEAAKLQTDDANLRRRHLEAAVEDLPASPEAGVALAQQELGLGHPDRSRTRLEKLLKLYPRFAAAQLALAHAEEELGEWPAASERIEAQYANFQRMPLVVREAARVARRLDRPQEAVDRLRVALSLRFDDEGSRRSLAALLADLSRVDEALSEYQTLLALDPFDNSTRLKLAELLCANGNREKGLARFAEAKALSPDESEVYEREGRALMQSGDAKGALASFEHALLLRPQNPGLREVLRSLKGEDGTSGLQYALDVAKLAKEAEAYEGEDAVVLADFTYVKVQPSGLSSTLRQLGVKVNSDRGVESYRSYPISYSPTRQEVHVLKARVTKPDGAVVESFGEQERNLNEPWTGMYYDARAKMLSFPTLAKGDTLEIEYRVEDTAQDNLLSDYWGDVDFVQGVHPKLRYQFLVEMPSKRPLYWNASTLGKGVVAAQQVLSGDRVLYSWKASRVSKVIPEPSMPGWSEVASTLHVSTYKTWDQVGRYYWGLVRDQLTPNDELRKTVDTVLKGVNRKDELAVVRAIYNFVVTNTRYVALEFGIHGFKPYRVDRILARRFGDCKDKASLIHALLKIAGVDSRLVLLRMRHLGALAEEPASLAAFNHAIAYVPKFNLYLDGTAEFTGSSELPSADHLANVLVVDPAGNSRFQTIPEATAEQNLTQMTMNVELHADGSAVIHGASTIAGENASAYRRAYQSSATRKANFEQGWARLFPGLTVKKVTVNDTSKLDQNVALDYEMSVPRFSEQSPGGLRFFPFGGGRNYTQEYAPLVERYYDVLLSSPWKHDFHYQYTLPKGFEVAQLPPELKQDAPFGHVELRCHEDGGKLACDGSLALTQTRIKAKDYPAFRAFVGTLDQAFSRKVVLTAPTAPRAGLAPASGPVTAAALKP